MKRIFWGIFLLFGLIICSSGYLYPVEISEKKDIAIFGVKSYEERVSKEILGYIDTTINHYFVQLKRFNVIGYEDYRIGEKSIDSFIKRIKEIRAKKAEQAGVYDEKFGTVVIRGEDFDRIVNSFLVVIPTLSKLTVEDTQIEVSSGNVTYYEDAYEVEVVIDINFINVEEGKKEASIRLVGVSTNENLEKAKLGAVENALSQIPYKIKNLDIFKIKSAVLEVRGDTVVFTLGEDMGVKPGDEYEVITKQEIGKTGKIVQLPTALLRVKRVYPDHSEARIVYQKEKVTEGDQVVEVGKMGIDVVFNAGIMKVDIPDMNYEMVLVDDIPVYPITNYFYFNLKQPSRSMSADVSIRVTKNLGYRFKGFFDGVGILNFPIWGGIGEIGILSNIYKRRFSLEFGIGGGVLYMSTFKKRIYRNGLLDYINIDDVRIDYDQDPEVSIYGFGVGVKGTAGFNFIINRDSSVHAGVTYRLYTQIKKWMVMIEETSGNKMSSVTIKSDSDNIYPMFGKMRSVSITGYEVFAGYSMRF